MGLKEEEDGWQVVWVLCKEEGDGWEEVWVSKRKVMDGRRSGS
jgi:hypothetical protein